ncbi:MAG TPA: DUF1549 and DUF1553 domain-containing protein [Prosthecobacter sp.]|nr:DUF1549 and DUF1553 domain-containing protein [Prosthecobacter sp.]HRK16272.1 DUF1549 and DUF1553 domain-containing protein [Prosthecobacter sp.]
MTRPKRKGHRALALLCLFCSPVLLAETLAPVDQRIGSEGSLKIDFQRHVLPLLSRAGCNGRDCHGSAQGKGGFQLSLFGYDFDADHKALTKLVEKHGVARADKDNPAASLMLKKPAREVAHKGGKRIEKGGWQYELLLRWIQQGAPAQNRQQRFERLEVAPAEIVFRQSGDTAVLSVVAVWADGTREDVTPLTRFQSNNDGVAAVEATGRVTARGAGDTHVVAFYDNGVAAVPVMQPLPGKSAHAVAATTVDRHIQTKLAKLGITPSKLCSDEEFLRRASIDMTGTLPTPTEVEAFLANTRGDKRARKIDELLQRPAYAAWWANKLCDFTGNNPQQQAELGQELASQWYDWIFRRIRENQPYDKLVADIVLATGRSEGQSYEEYAAEMSAYFRASKPADFTGRPTMPHYWTRRTMTKPEDKALSFAHSFLGIRLQCAQCHKHPFDQWTQQDFKQFTRFFEPVKFDIPPAARETAKQLAAAGSATMNMQSMMMSQDMQAMAMDGRVVPWRELYVEKGNRPELKLHLLGDRELTLRSDEDPREKIMTWMLEKDNPWFARAFVNRVWANYFNRGIVHPPDDFNPANPPSNEALLDHLAQGFVASGYDMKWLHREIVNSHAYQRSWEPNATNAGDERHFSRAVPRRIPAEVVYDSLAQIVAAVGELEEVRENLDRRAVGHLSMRMAGTYAMNIFGKPARATNSDCERSADPSLLQSLFLRNDPIMQGRLDDGGWLRELETRHSSSAQPPRAELEPLIREAWLRVLSRPPRTTEQERALAHFSKAASTAGGMRDLLWALLNTKEFILNH